MKGGREGRNEREEGRERKGEREEEREEGREGGRKLHITSDEYSCLKMDEATSLPCTPSLSWLTAITSLMVGVVNQ